MKNIFKEPNLSPPVTNPDPFLSITFQSDNSPLETGGLPRLHCPSYYTRAIFNVLHNFGLIDFVLTLYC